MIFDVTLLNLLNLEITICTEVKYDEMFFNTSNSVSSLNMLSNI